MICQLCFLASVKLWTVFSVIQSKKKSNMRQTDTCIQTANLNMKEFSILNFHRCFTYMLNYTLCCVLGLKEISINVMYVM